MKKHVRYKDMEISFFVSDSMFPLQWLLANSQDMSSLLCVLES